MGYFKYYGENEWVIVNVIAEAALARMYFKIVEASLLK